MTPHNTAHQHTPTAVTEPTADDPPHTSTHQNTLTAVPVYGEQRNGETAKRRVVTAGGMKDLNCHSKIVFFVTAGEQDIAKANL